jgi:hypothetical protein
MSLVSGITLVVVFVLSALLLVGAVQQVLLGNMWGAFALIANAAVGGLVIRSLIRHCSPS